LVVGDEGDMVVAALPRKSLLMSILEMAAFEVTWAGVDGVDGAGVEAAVLVVLAGFDAKPDGFVGGIEAIDGPLAVAGVTGIDPNDLTFEVEMGAGPLDPDAGTVAG